METPDFMNPLYDLSGCLDHEPDKCRDCDCDIYPSNESANPFYCNECFTLDHIQALMRRKRSSLMSDFGKLMAELHKEPEWESFRIKKL